MNFKKKVVPLFFTFVLSNTAFAVISATKEYVDQQMESLSTQITNFFPRITFTPGYGITITNNVVGLQTPTDLYVGKYYQGGVIFWLDEREAPTMHGLIADIKQSTVITWSNNSTDQFATSATGRGLYDGKANTAAILEMAARPGSPTFPAAQYCAARRLSSSQNDWYLPTFQELRLMILNAMTINTTIANLTVTPPGGDQITIYNTFYWTSNDMLGTTPGSVEVIQPSNLSQSPTAVKTAGSAAVRCVRSF